MRVIAKWIFDTCQNLNKIRKFKYPLHNDLDEHYCGIRNDEGSTLCVAPGYSQDSYFMFSQFVWTLLGAIHNACPPLIFSVLHSASWFALNIAMSSRNPWSTCLRLDWPNNVQHSRTTTVSQQNNCEQHIVRPTHPRKCTLQRTFELQSS